MITIRMCNDCSYTTIVMKDETEERRCEHCNGLMKIIARGEKE